jgi:hypothetical protein
LNFSQEKNINNFQYKYKINKTDMYSYKVKVKKVSGILKESVLPNCNVVVKSKTRLSKKSLNEKLNEHYNKYGLVVEEFNVTGFDNDEPAPYYTGNTASSTRIDRASTKKDKPARKAKSVEKETTHGLKVGDILQSSYGYNRTIHNFYKVIRTTGSSVVLHKLVKNYIDGDNGGWATSWRVMPIEDELDSRERPFTKRVKEGFMGDPCVKISSYEWAYKWDGHPKTETPD